MKAERRHELQQNTLAKVLSDLPLYVRFHANKILVGIIIICLIFLLIRHRMNAAAEAKTLARDSLMAARMTVGRLDQIEQAQPNEQSRLQERQKSIAQVQTYIDDVLNNTSDSDEAALRAEAMLIRGDLLWEVANLPPIPGSSTLPSAGSLPSSREALDGAERAYRDVVTQYPNQKMSRVAALFGLAAIEENRGNWDKAIEQYNGIINDATLPELYKQVARARMDIIPQIRHPTYLGRFSSTQPATAPSTMETATTLPATMPTTSPN